MQRQLPGMGTIIAFDLITPTSCQTDEGRRPDPYLKRGKLGAEVFCFSLCQVEALKNRILCVQETNTGFYCSSALANSKTSEMCSQTETIT